MDLPSTPRSFPLEARQRGLPLQRPDWPAGPPIKPAAERFEALLLARILPTAQPTTDAPLAAGGSLITEQTTRLRAEAIARSAPFGIARLIEKAPQ